MPGVDTLTRLDLEAVRQDYHILDRADIALSASVHLVSTESYTPRKGSWTDVEQVTPRGFVAALRFVPLLRDLLGAWRVLRRAGANCAIICNGGGRLDRLVCLLNRVLPIRRRKIVLWESHVQADSQFTRVLLRWMLQGCTVVAVYSRRLVQLQAEYIGVPESKFVFLPYKADHSIQPPVRMPIGNYIFSGGNSARDYRTLFEAVRGSDIPVIVSATSPEVTRNLETPSNVILLAAKEPAFARLMAGSRFVVIAMAPGLVVGAASASVCNAMWQGKPVIAADDGSLSEYIAEGVTGYVVAAGDVERLRKLIIELWNDPERVAEMGRRAHERVAGQLTHEHFIRRLNRLATLVAAG